LAEKTKGQKNMTLLESKSHVGGVEEEVPAALLL
jgi:hypothetical protein